MSSEHNHDHQHENEVLMHLRVAAQNIASIEAMIKDHRPCTEIVSRISGILATLIECRSLIAKDHISSCINAALKPGQENVLKEVTQLFQQLQKGPFQGSHH